MEGDAWQFTIRRWKPTSLNVLLRKHRIEQNRLIQSDKTIVMAEGHNAVNREHCPIPKATGRREVRLFFLGGSWGAMPDGDNALKAIADGLKACGLLMDDGFRHCRWGSIDGCLDENFPRDRVDTQVILTDIGPVLE